MGLIFHGFNASRPTEQTLQEEIRALKADYQRQQTLLLKERATVASTAGNFNSRQNSHQRVTAAYTSLKRGCMMRDMQSMVSDHEVGMTAGSVAHVEKTTQLADDVSTIHDTSLDTGVAQMVLTSVDAAPLYCTAEDSRWLLDQLQHDIKQHPFDVWTS